jgi:hypothetical protein
LRQGGPRPGKHGRAGLYTLSASADHYVPKLLQAARPLSFAPPLDPELAAFIQGGVSIAIATSDADRVPHVVRALGCRCDGRGVVVFVPARQAAAVLADVAATGAVAVVCSQPSTHRTVQLKGTDATVAAVGGDAVERVHSYRRAFVDELLQLGYPTAFTEALLEGSDQDLSAIAFTPIAAFSGTPGPQAGQRLGTIAAVDDPATQRSGGRQGRP